MGNERKGRIIGKIWKRNDRTERKGKEKATSKAREWEVREGK